MTKKPMLVSDLFNELKGRKSISWISLLKEEDYRFVMEVIHAAMERPDVSLLSIARSLIKELGIDRNTETVCRTLRELIRSAKQEQEEQE